MEHFPPKTIKHSGGGEGSFFRQQGSFFLQQEDNLFGFWLSNSFEGLFKAQEEFLLINFKKKSFCKKIFCLLNASSARERTEGPPMVTTLAFPGIA